MSSSEPALLTIGHSNHPLDQFLGLLRAHAVTRVLDVRTVPRSRHNPQFNRDALPAALEREGIGYTHLPRLGGLRRPRPDSPNRGWRHEGFRGFADYMSTPEFDAALDELVALAAGERVAILCAEAVPWRCHRTLIADALVARGMVVRHILGPQPPRPHALTSFARVEAGRVTYPEIAPLLPGLDPPIESARGVEPGVAARPAPSRRRARP